MPDKTNGYEKLQTNLSNEIVSTTDSFFAFLFFLPTFYIFSSRNVTAVKFYVNEEYCTFLMTKCIWVFHNKILPCMFTYMTKEYHWVSNFDFDLIITSEWIYALRWRCSTLWGLISRTWTLVFTLGFSITKYMSKYW